MAGAAQTIDVNVTPDKLFAVITDYARYPEFLPEVHSVQVLEKGEGTAVVKYTLKMIKTVEYTIRMTENAPNSVSWTLVDSNMLKANDGGWELQELPGGRTKASYRIEARVGRFVPGRIVDKLTKSTLPATLAAFKKRAESLG